jgi:tetrahydromethanopterin S-methyltransferase subunit F
MGMFTCRVFRPDDGIARAIVVAIGVAYVSAFVYRAATYGFAPIALGGAKAPFVHTTLTLITLTWSGIESLRYHLQLRKRLKLGLADALVTDRFRLWATGMLVATLLSGIASVFAWFGIAFNTTTAGILTTGILGSICAGSIWFAFFPPKFYASWVRGRAVSDPVSV